MIPLRIRQKLSYIQNRFAEFNFTEKQIQKFNKLLNDVIYEIDYSIVVEKVKMKKNGKARTRPKM